MEINITGPAVTAVASMRERSWLPMPSSLQHPLTVTAVAAASQPANVETPSSVGVGPDGVRGYTCVIASVSQLNMGDVCLQDIADRKFSTRLGLQPDSPPV